MSNQNTTTATATATTPTPADSSSPSNINKKINSISLNSTNQQQQLSLTSTTTPIMNQQAFMSIRDIMAQKLTMFNYKLPSDRTMYESSLIYCNLCEFSCDLTDKSAIICHYLSKHPDDNIVYSYLWPQMELNQEKQMFKIKYYLIKANLKVRTKDASSSSSSSSSTTTTTTTTNNTNTNNKQIEYPTSLLTSDDQNDQQLTTDSDDQDDNNKLNEQLNLNTKYVMNKMLDWIETNAITSSTSSNNNSQSTNNSNTNTNQTVTDQDVQELEEEQEVQEVEMSGEDLFDPSQILSQLNSGELNILNANNLNMNLDDLIKLTSSALYISNQQKYLINNNMPINNLQLDNNYLVHLLAINKIENVFRVKQIHDYYGGCFVCGKQVEFNLKHYQTHFNSEMTIYMCLHCNYKEYRQEQAHQPALGNEKKASCAGSSSPSTSCISSSSSSSSSSSTSSSATSSSSSQCTSCTAGSCGNCSLHEPYQIDNNADITHEEKQLQLHMSECHSIDFNQILQQHQQLQQNEQIDSASNSNSSGVVVIESTPMNDMYLSLQLKSIKYIDDDPLKRDQFRTDMIYSCPICTGDINVYATNQGSSSSTTTTSSSATSNSTNNTNHPYTQFENVTFDYLMNHFLLTHQFKAIPLFVCTQCNCVRVSLIDCIYHYIRYHFNKKIVIGLCGYNIYDKIQHQINQLQLNTNQSSNASGNQSGHHHGKKSSSAAAAAAASAAQNNNTIIQQLPVSATTSNTIYGAGPLIYCAICNENYSSEQAFIRHSFLAHLLDPNINLNWFKVYTPVSSTNQPMSTNFETSLQQIAAAMAMADLTSGGLNDGTISLVDANGQPISTDSSNLNLMYECPVCFKSVQSKDSISRHLLYHALNENYEYDITCSACNKQLSPLHNLADCLLHTREFRSHRLNINYSKYVLSTNDATSQTVPMVSCVLCNHESTNLVSSISHIMMDHFSYDSGVLRMKRFVNYMVKSLGLSTTGLTSTTPTKSQNESKFKRSIKQDSQLNPELVDYFSTSFPSLINELIVSLITASNKLAQSNTNNAASSNIIGNNSSNNNNNSNINSNKPDTFFHDVKCFKCGKFSTKLKNSLFQHLNQSHQFDLRDLDKLYDLHIQKQLQLIDEQNLVDKYEKNQKEVAQHQFNVLKELKDKNDLQYQQQKEQQKILIHQQQQVATPQAESSNPVISSTTQANSTTSNQEHSNNNNNQTNANNNTTTFISNTENPIQQSSNTISSSQNVHQMDTNSNQSQATPANNPNSNTASSTNNSTSLNNQQQEVLVPMIQQQTTHQQSQHHHQQQNTQSSASTSQTAQTVPNTKSKQNSHAAHSHSQISSSAIDKIDSTIDQVLSQICKEDYDKSEPMMVDQNQASQQQITVHAQPPEAENLFVFKCNLCDPYTTDDATQLLEHYKLMHQVELTIADSSTLLAAAVAAFQTGHTIEMTGAILNTISSVTDENGLTIISGEEVPVHTTVQYKCTICQMIFYEKQYIVQHLYEMHNFEIDISYFEEIELQQQEQLQQKIYEQQQEQLMLQQQQQIEQQQHQQQNNNLTDQHQPDQQHQALQQHQNVNSSATNAALVPTGTTQSEHSNIADETAAVMMMMMNPNQATGIILQPNQLQHVIATNQGEIPTAQIVINPQNITQLNAADVTALPTAILAAAIPATSAGQLPQGIATATPIQSISAHPISVDSSSTNTIQQKPAINYSCNYCGFGADKLRKMSDHLKQSHPLREKTCMDNTRQQLIKLPNEDLPPYNQNPTTVASLLNMHQQQLQQQQQQQQHQQQMAQHQLNQKVTASSSSTNLSTSSIQQHIHQQQQSQGASRSSSLIDNLSNSLVNTTSSLASVSNTIESKPHQATGQHQQAQAGQNQQQQAHPIAGPVTTGKKRGPKPKTSPGNATRPQTVANTLSKQQQQHQQNLASQNAGIRTPTILTMDANSQIIIDFNQNDDLLCSYCEYTMNNLNYMRTHIKYKHKNMPITFQNKLTYRFYTIVEWPLTPVPTLTPASQSTSGHPQPTQTQTQAQSQSTGQTQSASNASHIPQQQQQQNNQQTQQVQQQHQQTQQQSHSQHSTNNLSQPSLQTHSNQVQQTHQQQQQQQTQHQTQQQQFQQQTINQSQSTTSTSISSQISQLNHNLETSSSSMVQSTHTGQSVQSSQITSNSVIDTSANIQTTPTVPTTTKAGKLSAKENKESKLNSSLTSATGTTSSPGGININNVNSILKKLGVNKNITTGSSPLTNLISTIGAGKTVNNSVVNVNLNVLKDVNIDEMIDDDDDEERKFLIKELEKKATMKRGVGGVCTGKDQSNGDYNSDTGSTSGGVKRSRSNSSTNTQRNPITNLTANPASPSSTSNSATSTTESKPLSNALTPLNSSSASNQSQSLLSQLNITLNCHYCWAQFQLNVTKNLKNSIQQKENGKYMQHLTLHLNAPYKCNECSYPITDTKTFFKHKQFYKHDEKTCIMVDNDISPSTSSSNQNNNNQVTRRKTLIATRLRQHIQQQQQIKEEEKLQQQQQQQQQANELVESNEIQLYHDRDSFKCSLCYGDTDAAPSTSVSSLNKSPTNSNLGASNFSFDKEQVLKHVLIVHLSFLAYKCDTCSQFYAFDEPQTKQHAALVHHCGIGSAEGTTCHFKLIKTEEEINLAINRAQQFITKITASKKPTDSSSTTISTANSTTTAAAAAAVQVKTRQQSTPSTISSNTPIEAHPKYKCCKCNNISPASNSENSNEVSLPTQNPGPVLLYSYQDALDHVMNIHMNQNSQQQKKDKKLNYELELFEQNLEDLLASETGIITTISATSNHLNPNEDDELDLDENDEEQGELADDYYYGTNSDLSEWNVILSEPYYVSNAPSSPSQLSPQITGNKRKRFKTNNNQSISFPSSSSELDLAYLNNGNTNKKLKRFYYKPYFIYKCQICCRKMNSFDPEHWLKHDAENHSKLFNFQQQATTDSKFVYQQINCSKNPSTSTGSNTLALTATTGVNSATATSGSTNSNNTNQISKTYKSFTEFLKNFKSDSLITNLNDSDISFKLINCLICGVELKYTYIDVLKHFQSEHEFNIFDLGLDLNDLELIQALQMNNQLQLSEGVNLRRKCFIKIPPMLVNPSVPGSPNITKVDLIDKEIKLLNEIYKEQIVEKQIVSWLNSEQFLRRNFNYNSYVCIICNSSKMSILESHYNLKKGLNINNNATNNAACLDSGRLQYFTDEMKTVVLTNHILGHFNEYCYRCMSCKISWPDRTQLLKHAQECSNSQVVRTKTKYKLKANCRLQLKFYLQTYLDYWSHEKAIELKSIDSLIPNGQNVTTLAKTDSTPSVEQKLKCKVIMKDIFLNKNLLLDASSRFDLNKITLDDGRKIVLKSEEQETSMTGVAGGESVVNTSESGIEAEQDQEQEKIQENKSNDVQMRDESSEPTSLEQTTEKTE